jgi:ribosomal protein S18 acetylase RimI-like enzyme
MTILAARKADAPAMAATLAAAFVDDPALSWIMPDPSDRHARLSLFFPPMVRGAISRGLGLRSEDDAVVTLWRLPGRIHPSFLETLVALPTIGRALGDGVERSKVIGEALRQQAPKLPYWYLQFAGVAPDRQGRGLGGQAIRAGLERARAARFPVYLETARPGNVAIYQSLGFRIVGEWDIPGGGPHFWGMICD